MRTTTTGRLQAEQPWGAADLPRQQLPELVPVLECTAVWCRYAESLDLWTAIHRPNSFIVRDAPRHSPCPNVPSAWYATRRPHRVGRASVRRAFMVLPTARTDRHTGGSGIHRCSK